MKRRSAGVSVVCLALLRVLQLMNLTDSRLAQAGNERLELAMLSFFEQFRKIYIGDQVQKSSKVINQSNRFTAWNKPVPGLGGRLLFIWGGGGQVGGS